MCIITVTYAYFDVCVCNKYVARTYLSLTEIKVSAILTFRCSMLLTITRYCRFWRTQMHWDKSKNKNNSRLGFFWKLKFVKYFQTYPAYVVHINFFFLDLLGRHNSGKVIFLYFLILDTKYIDFQWLDIFFSTKGLALSMQIRLSISIYRLQSACFIISSMYLFLGLPLPLCTFIYPSNIFISRWPNIFPLLSFMVFNRILFSPIRLKYLYVTFPFRPADIQ